MDSIIAYSMRMMRRLNNYLMIHPVPSLIFHFVATTKLKIKKELIDSFHTSQEKEPETFFFFFLEEKEPETCKLDLLQSILWA